MTRVRPLAEIVGDARIVLVAGVTDGTDEFPAIRAEITKWLVERKGFCAVAVEADWSDAYRVNRYVRGMGTDRSAEGALRGLAHLPAWTWRSAAVRDFVEWLHDHDAGRAARGGCRTGFYGLDPYDTDGSIREVTGHLDRVDLEVAAGPSRERDVVARLVAAWRRSLPRRRGGGLLIEDRWFLAQQDAITLRDVERYYRAMFDDRVTWCNLRARHMANTLQALQRHMDHDHRLPPARIVVWTADVDAGDAPAPGMSGHRRVTLGRLVRERCGEHCRVIGPGDYDGTVVHLDHTRAVDALDTANTGGRST